MDSNLYGQIQAWVTLQDTTVVKSTGLGPWLHLPQLLSVQYCKSLSVPQFLHLQGEDNGIHLRVIFELHWFIHIKHLGQCLVHNQCLLME